MDLIRKKLIASSFAVLMALVALPCLFAASPAFSSEIKYIVNDVPITSYDIDRRAAFFKLQGRGAAKKSAADDMIEQTLKLSEMKRLRINISDQMVEDAFARFASSNKMTAKQMEGILQQSGVTKGHFKDFIRTQMGWNQALGAKFRSAGTSEQNAVQNMLQKGGTKPSATEYMLQQVIFVVPAKERKGLLGKRKREADAMRQRFSGCDSTRQFAKGLIDVTVRDLGKVLAPELPPEWADAIKKAKIGSATGVRETDRGVEFIGICSSREVSDDRVAEMLAQTQGGGGEVDKKADELSKKYVAELREKARIVKR